MTLAVLPNQTTSLVPAAGAAASPRGALLLRIMQLLEDSHIPCVILHGYENFPRQVNGDVDCLIPAKFLPSALAHVLHENANRIGARIVQWFTDGSHLIVLSGWSDDGSRVVLQLHVTSQYEVGGRVVFCGEEIIESRQRKSGFFTPSPDVEFACILSNRLSKEKLTDGHCQRLAALYKQSPQDCYRRTARLLPPDSAHKVLLAARTGCWELVQRHPAALWRSMSRRLRRPAGRAARFAGKLRRWIKPRNGFHAVFLGPDGVGKSTTIEAFERNLGGVFLESTYLTFAPGLLPRRLTAPKPGGPHSLPPRSLPASLAKAAWWAVCYTLGYDITIRPVLARGGLVVNHRYLIDAIVDQKRYRYGGPVGLLRAIWIIAPKPDVVFLLDADAKVIQSRKQEVPFEETAAQVAAYRSVIAALPIGKIINADQPRWAVADEVTNYVLDEMARRTARRLGLEAGAKRAGLLAFPPLPVLREGAGVRARSGASKMEGPQANVEPFLPSNTCAKPSPEPSPGVAGEGARGDSPRPGIPRLARGDRR